VLTANKTKPMKTSIIPESPKKEANIDKYGDVSNSCIVCGKPTKEKLLVHLTTDGTITNEGDESKIDNSQGFFPIGSNCAKQIEKEFVFKG